MITLFFALGCFVIPVHADSDPFMNVLDYSGINDTSELYYRLKSGYNHLWFNLPSSGVIKYIDMVVYTDKPMQSASACRIEVANGASDWASLQIDPLGDGYYRIHGDPGRIYSWPQIWLNIEVSANTDFQVCSFYVSFTEFSVETLSAYGNVFNYSVPTSSHLISYNASERTEAEFLTENYEGDTSWKAQFIVDYERADTISVCLKVETARINSISVNHGNEPVPFECSPILSGTDTRIGYYYITLIIDVRNIDRFSNYDLTVIVSGQGAIDRTNKFRIDYVYGNVDVEHMDPITFWFYQLKNWLEDGFQRIVDAIMGDADSNEFEQGVTDANDKLSDASDAMNDFTRPAADSVVPDLGVYDSSAVDVLSQFFNNQLVSPLVTAGLAIWLIGIIFGV